MDLLTLVRAGRTRELRAFLPRHIEATAAEVKAGSLSWLLSALGWPEIPGDVLGYGTIIGTGNAVIEWDPASPALAHPAPPGWAPGPDDAGRRRPMTGARS
jgi:hypothetical protein